MFLISFIGLYFQTASAQSLNINNDTIFLSMEAEVQIVFPTRPIGYSTVPAVTQYRIWDVKTGIYLIPGSADYTPATLLVSEAGREHRFILIFKQFIANNEAKLYYDYSTVNKLAQHTRSKAIDRSVVSRNTAINTEPAKNDRIKTINETEAKLSEINETEAKPPEDSSSKYYTLLEQGEKEFRLQNYGDAVLNFNKAHTLRPQDGFPLQRIEDIKIKLAEKEDSVKAGNERKYNAATAAGKYALDQKNYTSALEAYKQALELKPGDVLATRQLQTVSNLLLKVNTPKEIEKVVETDKVSTAPEKILSKKETEDEHNYNIAIESADSYFKNGNYDSAKALYNAALIFSERDWPIEQVKRINIILNRQDEEAIEDKAKLLKLKIDSALKPKSDSVLSATEIKMNYNLAVAKGRSSYIKNDLINAKIFYEEARELQPLQQEPVSQLKIIDTKLEAIARETEINNNYERIIVLADSQIIAKDYEPASISYKEASILKPLESYPRKQIKYIQSELAAIEKRKTEEKERRYNDLLIMADKAVADKKYDDAKSGYTEALGIHPDNEYAKRRLEIISFQLEKARLNKPGQDSVKEVAPVKKSGRKKSS